MSQYNYARFISDFCARTKTNLEFAQEGNTPYDVTLLLSSFLALLVIPYQLYWDKNDLKIDPESRKKLEVIIERLKSEGRVASTYEEILDTKAFIRHIRNAISHPEIRNVNTGLTFYPISSIDMYDQNKEITHIFFCDQNFKKCKERFVCKLSTDEIKQLLDLVSNCAINSEKIRLSDTKESETLGKKIQSLDDFLRSTK